MNSEFSNSNILEGKTNAKIGLTEKIVLCPKVYVGF